MWYPLLTKPFTHFLSNRVPAALASPLLKFAIPEAETHPGIIPPARYDSVITPDINFRPALTTLPVMGPNYSNVVVDLYAMERAGAYGNQ